MNRTRLRTMVAKYLTDTCSITAASALVYDAELGHDTETAGAAIYTGACRVRPYGGQRVVRAGEAPVVLRLFDVTVPWDIVGIHVDHLVTITASDDPHMIDRVLRVVDVQGGSDTPHRRLVCEDTLPRSYVEAT